MSDKPNSWNQLFAEFTVSRALENALRERMTEALEAPASAVALPDRIITIYALAKTAFGTEALRFLTQPHMLLGGDLPLSVAQHDEAGAQRVEQILGRLIHGTSI